MKCNYYDIDCLKYPPDCTKLQSNFCADKLKEENLILQNKLYHRNMQIKELKKQLAETIERNEDIYGNREKFSDGHPRTKNQ